jgi:hypothetical protein
VNWVLFCRIKIAIGDSLHLDVHRIEVSSLACLHHFVIWLLDGKELSVPK